jgi:hypothetical protein
MLSPSDLLDFAQTLSMRIPPSSEYAEERNAAWLAVGMARLRFDDVINAHLALQNIDALPVQAQLRVAIGNWAGEHQGSEVGHDVLLDTISRFSAFECCLARNEISEFIPSVFKLLGMEAVHSIARQLKDPFTAGNVYVMLAYQLPDAAARREQLLIAEKLAASVCGGDRDWALRWVFRGYQWAGLTEDVERVRRLASKDPEELTREEGALLSEANTLLANVDEYTPQQPAETPLARLRRFLDYRFNDLKVVLLADASLAGSVTDPEMEELIRSDSFQRIEAPRPMRLTGDTSSFDAGGMAQHLFGRPVCRHPADRKLLEGENYLDSGPDAVVFVRQMSRLFRDFGRLAEPFSPEQIEQGLWFVLGHPFWLPSMLEDRRVLPEWRDECLRSMIHPFRDYYLQREDSFAGTAFYMWWDLLLAHTQEGARLEIETIAVDVLRQILRLPSKGCQFAALHGLNHMHPSPAAAAAVRQYLKDHRKALTDDQITWVEACANGAYM